jgi:hypothetical protein
MPAAKHESTRVESLKIQAINNKIVMHSTLSENLMVATKDLASASSRIPGGTHTGLIAEILESKVLLE